MDRQSHPYPPSTFYPSNTSPQPVPQYNNGYVDGSHEAEYLNDDRHRQSTRSSGYGQHQLYPSSSPTPQPLLSPSQTPYGAPLSRTRSDSDPTIPLAATIHPSNSMSASKSTLFPPSNSVETLSQAERLDKNGIPLPPGWTKEDEEAEREFLEKGMIDWKEIRDWRFWIRKEWWAYYLGLALLAVVVVLMTIYHDQIVKWLEPAAVWMQNLPAGWTIPIAVLFVLSFPPLFGQEIVIIIVGLVWGLWIGFGIVSAGTFLGEFGNFYAFKYCLRRLAEKYERKNLNYACMAYVVREGGFWIVFMARLSAIPGHFTTAVFATCGTNIWIFCIATIITLPKQLVIVYLGVIFKQSGEGQETNTSKVISYSVLVVGGLVTVLAAWYIYHKMHKARVVVWRQRRMIAASKGVSLKPDLGGAMQDRVSYKEYPEGGANISNVNLIERRSSPVPGLSGAGGYQNPYDSRYHHHDDTPAYDPHNLPEQDMGTTGFAMTSDYPIQPQSQAFPSPIPHHPAGLRREATHASTTYTYGRDERPEPTHFPVSRPSSTYVSRI